MSANALYDQVVAVLAKPFPPDDVQWKPQSTSRDRKRALAVAYVGSRTYSERLDEAIAAVGGCEPWEKRLEILDMGDRVAAICHLTIAGVTRSGDGECVKTAGKGVEPNAVTSASAQAFKRANAEHGLGRYLYKLPKVWVDYDRARRSITSQSLAQLKRMLETGEHPGGNGKKDARAVVVHVGDKHKGKTLGQIATEDPSYIEWLKDNWQWDEGRRAAAAIWAWLEQQKAEARQPQALPRAQPEAAAAMS